MLTDTEILDLTTITFVNDSSDDVMFPINDVSVVDVNRISINGTVYNVGNDSVVRVLVKKGKFELYKRELNEVDMTKYIENIIDSTFDKKLSNVLDNLQSHTNDVKNSATRMFETYGHIVSNIKTSDIELRNLTASFKDLHTNSKRVMDELKVIIED